jgi:hypothetical protein
MHHSIILLTTLLFSGIVSPHPIHISKCEIEHDKRTKTLQVTLHIFIDDLELAIAQAGLASELKLGTEFEKENSDRYIELYLKEHLQVFMNEERVELEFLGKELSRDYMAFWCFLESQPIEDINGIEIIYDALMEVYEDQKNIFNITTTSDVEKYHLFRSRGQIFRLKLP